MNKVLQQIITELEKEKGEWIERADNTYDWAVIHKAHAQGTVSGLSDAIFIIKKYVEVLQNMDNVSFKKEEGVNSVGTVPCVYCQRDNGKGRKKV